MEQLSLFETRIDNRKVKVFIASYCNEDWTTKTVGKERIVDSFSLELTKEELKNICRRSVQIENTGQYGYSVFYKDHGIKKNIFVRFVNYKSSKKRSVFEHIDQYFDKEWEWLNKGISL